MVLITVFLISVLPRMKKIKQRVVCGVKIKYLSAAIIVYTDGFEGQYPLPEQWCDLIMEETGDLIEDAFRCPVDPEGSFSYAINENLYNIEPRQVDPQKFVVLFEADLGKNGVGGPEDLVLRHDENDQLGCNIAFADGHVEFVREDHIADLQWTVE